VYSQYLQCTVNTYSAQLIPTVYSQHLQYTANTYSI